MSVGAECHAFLLEECSLPAPSWYEASAGIHHPVAGQTELLWHAVQQMAHEAGVLWAACQERYLAVGNHLSPRDGGYYMVDFLS